ncbi:MAG: ATP-binding protein [Candidatus Micrarchaeota archaeon]
MTETYIEREIEKNIYHWLNAKEILAIRGPRQSGKTTLLKRIVGMLRNTNIDNNTVHLLSMEDDEERMRFESSPKEIVEYYLKKANGRHYFLIDEIQCVKNAGKILKLLYDKYENIKIIITGSSALDLVEISSYLVGRILFFELFPFSFSEFLDSKDKALASIYREIRASFKEILAGNRQELPKTAYLDKLNSYLKEYLIYGGYPRICLSENAEDKKFLLKNLVQTYIEKDVIKLYRIKHSDEFLILLKTLSNVTGDIINYNSLCNQLNISYKDLKQMLHILKSTYILTFVSPFYRNMITELRKNPKVYFIDTGLRNYLLTRFEFNATEMGALFENHVFNCLRNANPRFWRTTAKAEVDFILPNKTTPLEVKSTNASLTRSLRSFITVYKPQLAFILNLNKISLEKIDETNLFYAPFSYL